MTNRIASLLVVLAPLTLTGCDSSNGPMAPTPVVETSGASTFSKPRTQDRLSLIAGNLISAS
jgi:hypothetical protein